MHLFECEREETNHLLLECQDTLQKQIETYESLYFKAEANHEELLKAKEELMLFEDLKNKFQQEYNLKEQEIRVLQSELKEKDDKLNNILLDLHETKAQCRMLQEEIDQKSDLLNSLNAERDLLVKDLQEAKLCCSETEKAMASLVEKNEEAARVIQSKDLNLQQLNKEKTQQTERLEQMQMTVNELKKSLAAEILKAQELEGKVTSNLTELEKTQNDLGEARQLIVKKEEQIRSLMEKLDVNTNAMAALNNKLAAISDNAAVLTSELLKKTEEAQQLKGGCEKAEKELEEFKVKSTLAQVKVDELQKHLIEEKKKIEEKNSKVFQLQGEITQLKLSYENLLSNVNELQSAKSALEQMLDSRCITAQSVEEKIKIGEEKAQKLKDKVEQIEHENHQLSCELNSTRNSLNKKCEEMEALKKTLEENEENFQKKMSEKDRRIRVFETKNKALKKQVTKESVKTTELIDKMNILQEETHNLKQMHEEESQKSILDQQKKSADIRKLEVEVEKLQLEAKEAISCKEDAELKCQSKIADMVTLMDKHKNQYDQVVQEKDAELEASKQKELKAVGDGKSLKQELTKQKKENDSLKKKLREHLKEKETLQKELTDLKNEKKILRESKQLPICDDKKEEVLKSPAESLLKLYKFDFSKARHTPSSNKHGWTATAGNACTQASDCTSTRTSEGTTPKSMGIQSEKVKTPKSSASKSSSKIKTYRIRTPPSTENKSSWGKRSIELDPKSDSSNQGDFFTFANTSAPISASCLFQRSLPSNKSPKNSVKLAAVKRMRDAGWNAVTGKDKKKKSNESIFA